MGMRELLGQEMIRQIGGNKINEGLIGEEKDVESDAKFHREPMQVRKNGRGSQCRCELAIVKFGKF